MTIKPTPDLAKKTDFNQQDVGRDRTRRRAWRGRYDINRIAVPWPISLGYEEELHTLHYADLREPLLPLLIEHLKHEWRSHGLDLVTGLPND